MRSDHNSLNYGMPSGATIGSTVGFYSTPESGDTKIRVARTRRALAGLIE